MFVEEYTKTRGGKTYYAVYYRFGKVSVEVHDILAKDKADAAEKAKRFMDMAVNQDDK